MHGLGLQQRGPVQVGGRQPFLGGGVLELAALRRVNVAVPAPGGKPRRVMSEYGRGGPAVDEIGDDLGEVRALVDDPAYGAREVRSW